MYNKEVAEAIQHPSFLNFQYCKDPVQEAMQSKKFITPKMNMLCKTRAFIIRDNPCSPIIIFIITFTYTMGISQYQTTQCQQWHSGEELSHEILQGYFISTQIPREKSPEKQAKIDDANEEPWLLFTPVLKHTYTKEPWQYKGYYQACHQEVTEWLSTPTPHTPIWWPNTTSGRS